MQVFRQFTVIDPAGPYHDRTVDIHVEAGKIAAIGENLAVPKGSSVYTGGGTHVSPGWLDLGPYVGDPGREEREDLTSLARAGGVGGYTSLAILPNTHPPVTDKASVRYVRTQSGAEGVELLPLGAISQGTAGKDLAELIDMHRAGAPAFTDGKKPAADAGLLLRALDYVRTFDGVVINQPLDASLAPDGQIHEGIVSTRLGMTGIPTVSETIMLERDLRLLAYSGSRLHVHLLSTAEGVELVRQAKRNGLRVTASAAVLNLAFTVKELADFNPNFKVSPPLRSEKDRLALIAGVADGTIDCVCSNHQPREPEAKALEFPYADFGAAGLETAFGLAWSTLRSHLPLARLIDALTAAPRRCLQLPALHLAPDSPAAFTLFDPDSEWTVALAHLRSKSHNNPLIGRKLHGRATAIFTQDQLWNH